MIAENEPITSARKAEIRGLVNSYIEKHGISQSTVARECAASKGTVSEVLRGVYGVKKKTGGKPCDDTEYLRRLNNWMELHARRQNIIQNAEFVETTVAREIVTVAEIVSETCKMGVVYGHAQIGKSFTLKALAGSDRLGSPVLFRIDQSQRTPKALCRMVCARFELPTEGTFDTLSRRLVKQLDGTKRMLMFDEAERCTYQALEWIRDLHDQTGCPVLLCGKPDIYSRLGFREIGGYRKVVDQLSNRIIIRRDLTERTRTDPKNPQPLFTIEDVRKLIAVAKLGIRVSSEAVQWLQKRMSCVGLGGVGMAKILLYLGLRYAASVKADAITVEVLEEVEKMTLGDEDAKRAEGVADDPATKKISRIA